MPWTSTTSFGADSIVDELLAGDVALAGEHRRILLRMFERRLRGYRAIGYARSEAPLGLGEASAGVVVEYDGDAVDGPDALEFS